MGVLRDITHQKQDKELLQFQANVLSNVQDSVIVTNPQGRFGATNYMVEMKVK